MTIAIAGDMCCAACSRGWQLRLPNRSTLAGEGAESLNRFVWPRIGRAAHRHQRGELRLLWNGCALRASLAAGARSWMGLFVGRARLHGAAIVAAARCIGSNRTPRAAESRASRPSPTARPNPTDSGSCPSSTSAGYWPSQRLALGREGPSVQMGGDGGGHRRHHHPAQPRGPACPGRRRAAAAWPRRSTHLLRWRVRARRARKKVRSANHNRHPRRVRVGIRRRPFCL